MCFLGSQPPSVPATLNPSGFRWDWAIYILLMGGPSFFLGMPTQNSFGFV